MTAETVYIAGKNGQYLTSARPDERMMSPARRFSQYKFDAKRYSNPRAAGRAAMLYGCSVFRFNPFTGIIEKITESIPDEANCGNCRMRRGFDGVCRCGNSEYYGEAVLCGDCCECWEESAEWTIRRRKSGS